MEENIKYSIQQINSRKAERTEMSSYQQVSGEVQEPKKESSVLDKHLSDYRLTQAQVLRSLDELVNRLEPVMIPKNQSKPSDVSEVPEVSPLVSDVRAMTGQLYAIQDILQDVLRRLEV